MNYDAESIAAALFTKLQTVAGLNYSSRILRTIGETPMEDMPALYQTMGDPTPINDPTGLPIGWKYEHIVYVFLHNPDAQAATPVASSTVLNAFLEAIKTALAPVPTGMPAGYPGSMQVLGDTTGRIRHAWISGPVWTDEGFGGENLYLIFPVEVEVR
jgi:hypothetical protein